MDKLDIICKNCLHSFSLHQQATFGLWYCDYEDSCICNNFEQKHDCSYDMGKLKIQVNGSYELN